MTRFRIPALILATLLIGFGPVFAPPFGRVVPHPPEFRIPHTDPVPGQPRTFDFKFDPETGRSVPKKPSAEFQAILDLLNELEKENPNVQEILKLAERSKWTDFDQINLALSASLHKAKGEVVDVPIDPSKPNLTIRRPKDSVFDPTVQYLTDHVRDVLQKPVDRDAVVLLPLTFSSDAAAKLAQDIPLYKRAQGAWMERLAAGNFEEIDARMFAALRGKTVVVVGHVVEIDGAPAFEVRRVDGGRRYIPISALLRASKKNGFNFLPLGCETAETMGLGTATKINDLDAIDAFKRAMHVSGKTSFGELLSDLSSDELKLTIDLGQLQDRSSVPIDIVDSDGRTYRPYGGPINSVASQSQPSATTQAQSTALAQVSPTTVDAGNQSEDVAVSALDGSLWVNRWSGIFEQSWSRVYACLAILTIVIALFELPFRRAVPEEERIKAGLVFVFFGGLAALWIGYILGNWLTQPEQGWSLVAAVVSWMILLQMRKSFPDHITAILTTKIVVVWNQLPLISHALISILQYYKLLADPLRV